MKNLTWEQEIERLKELFKEGLLSDNDKEEVAEKFNTSVSQVEDCSMEIDINNMPKTAECYKCHGTFSFDEIARNNGYCDECEKEELDNIQSENTQLKRPITFEN